MARACCFALSPCQDGADLSLGSGLNAPQQLMWRLATKMQAQISSLPRRSACPGFRASPAGISGIRSWLAGRQMRVQCTLRNANSRGCAGQDQYEVRAPSSAGSFAMTVAFSLGASHPTGQEQSRGLPALADRNGRFTRVPRVRPVLFVLTPIAVAKNHGSPRLWGY